MGSVDIPSKQRAAVRNGTGESATAPIEQIDVKMPGPGQILVKINWTGLCASVSTISRCTHNLLMYRRTSLLFTMNGKVNSPP